MLTCAIVIASQRMPTQATCLEFPGAALRRSRCWSCNSVPIKDRLSAIHPFLRMSHIGLGYVETLRVKRIDDP